MGYQHPPFNNLELICFLIPNHPMSIVIRLSEREKDMANHRIIKGFERSKEFEIEVDGEKITAFQGETIASALIGAGRQTFRRTPKKNQPRGLYCGIGLCYECMMVVDGVPNTRACQTLATPGCRVETQEGLGKRGKGN
jgi:hypothetical protein